jgi:hypothetical protein
VALLEAPVVSFFLEDAFFFFLDALSPPADPKRVSRFVDVSCL